MAEGNRISSVSPDNLVLQLICLRQSSSVQAYMDQFDEIRTRANLTEQRVYFTEQFTISCVLTGLRPDIAIEVTMMKPGSLRRAFSLAKLVEQYINFQKSYSSSATTPIDIKAQTPEAEPSVDNLEQHDEATSGDIEAEDNVYEATPNHLDSVEGEETDSDAVEFKSDVNKELIEDADSDETFEIDITFSIANSDHDVQDSELDVYTTEEVLDGREICVVSPPMCQLGLVSHYFIDPFLASHSRCLAISVRTYGFRRVSCPVAADFIHFFGKFGEIHDAFTLFVKIPHPNFMSYKSVMLEFVLLYLLHCCLGWKMKSIKYWCYSSYGCVSCVIIGKTVWVVTRAALSRNVWVVTRAALSRNASKGVTVQRRGSSICKAGLCYGVAKSWFNFRVDRVWCRGVCYGFYLWVLLSLKGDILVFQLLEPYQLKVYIVRVQKSDVVDEVLYHMTLDAYGGCESIAAELPFGVMVDSSCENVRKILEVDQGLERFALGVRLRLMESLLELASCCPSAGSAYHYSYLCAGEGFAWLIAWALLVTYDFYGPVASPKHNKLSKVPDIYHLATKTKGVFINPVSIEAEAHGLLIVATQMVDLLTCMGFQFPLPKKPEDQKYSLWQQLCFIHWWLLVLVLNSEIHEGGQHFIGHHIMAASSNANHWRRLSLILLIDFYFLFHSCFFFVLF